MKAMESAFQNIRECISNSCVLTIPLPKDAMSVVTDASGLGIGGVLQVRRGDEWEGNSSLLQLADKRSRATLLCYRVGGISLVETINHFGYYLYGKQFLAYTDHKPLCQLMTSDRLNGRLRILGMKPQNWLVEMCYVPGPNRRPLARRENQMA